MAALLLSWLLLIAFVLVYFVGLGKGAARMSAAAHATGAARVAIPACAGLIVVLEAAGAWWLLNRVLVPRKLGGLLGAAGGSVVVAFVALWAGLLATVAGWGFRAETIEAVVVHSIWLCGLAAWFAVALVAWASRVFSERLRGGTAGR